ncbi:ABC transporter ATP-binding protein [Rhodoferax aquaticus]|uniref:ABC transporter ATP-binding protein n=1 Tax=Rhodoferax aquaticus TaxID=2527691 RepID=A0A515EUD1_9BURK|nr:ABC transporter ATP-binding protein [Rhodoferax aquaticus]QDL56261.1 ABC transporter ATP-binding protein [Rhodoferax aquaticus]
MSTVVTPSARLEVRGLSTSFATDAGRVQSVADVSFSIAPGQTLALVGESGSGKSVTSLSLMGLHAKTSQAQMQGEAWFVRRDGGKVNLIGLAEPELRALRGNQMAMIFQEPMTSLNPVLTIGSQIAESARLHLKLDAKAASAHALRMLELVEIPAAARRLHEYPHQLSGGMRQRVMIALAMACNPSLLIADEPTTALDVTIQAQILALMGRLQKETGMSLLFITHNLGVVAQYADAVAVMYAGRIVESAPVHDLFASPEHPYTRGLLACLPGVARQKAALSSAALEPVGTSAPKRPRLVAIAGQVSSPFAQPPGCAFAPRCPQRTEACEIQMPTLLPWGADRMVRCPVTAATVRSSQVQRTAEGVPA